MMPEGLLYGILRVRLKGKSPATRRVAAQSLPSCVAAAFPLTDVGSMAIAAL